MNGSDVEEDVNAGTAIIPNLDAIAEFRIVTSNFDAEYGEFSGGQISVITKSGSNKFHGSAFDFLRNTDLDARNYFSPTRGAFRQNQFGGTFGGPLRRNKVSSSRLSGDPADTGHRYRRDLRAFRCRARGQSLRPDQLLDRRKPALTGCVSGPYLAGLLSQELGLTVAADDPYSLITGCTPRQAGLRSPNGVIPQNAWSVPAQRMLQYIPAPNTANGLPRLPITKLCSDDKGALRMDANTRWGLLSAYYFIDDFTLDNPYPVAQSGASVPGFDALTTGRAQLVALGDTKDIDATAVNELHLSYLRDFTNLGQPWAAWREPCFAGFCECGWQPQHCCARPQGAERRKPQFQRLLHRRRGQSAHPDQQHLSGYRYFSKVLGNHTIKFGAESHADQVNAHAIAQFNGSFVFSGTETGVDFADFLIGVPSQYNQSQLNPFLRTQQICRAVCTG